MRGWANTEPVGTYLQQGLPNITGYAGLTKNGGMNGAFYEGNQGRAAGKGDTFSTSECYFDASRSNPIYGRYPNVIPESVSTAYIIKY